MGGGLSSIRSFVESVDQGSFSAAAKARGMSVQAVSNGVSRLECKLGATLFERQHDGIIPTPFASALYSRAKLVLRAMDELERFAQGEQSEGGGPVSRTSRSELELRKQKVLRFLGERCMATNGEAVLSLKDLSESLGITRERVRYAVSVLERERMLYRRMRYGSDGGQTACSFFVTRRGFACLEAEDRRIGGEATSQCG